MRKDQYGHEANDTYTFVPIKVAGVTYKNGRRSRQTILRQIKWKDDPYQRLDGIDLIPTEYEGFPAVEIWVYNKKAREMIGYVPKTEASFVHSRVSNFAGYFDFEIYGGGKKSDGSSLSYGASLVLRFSTDKDAILSEDVPTSREILTEKSIERAKRATSPLPSNISSKSDFSSIATENIQPPKSNKKAIVYLLLFFVLIVLCLYFNR